jgi:hypothetical protein
MNLINYTKYTVPNMQGLQTLTLRKYDLGQSKADCRRKTREAAEASDASL